MRETWPIELPRLAELADAAQDVSPNAYERWFDGIPLAFRQIKLARESYIKLESELAVITGDAWNSFKEKIASSANSNRRELISLLNEADGYARLKQLLEERNISYDCIVEPETTATKPDWVALSSSATVAAIEVKTLWNSDEENAYVDGNTQKLASGIPLDARRVVPEISDGLTNKLKGSVATGKAQLKQFVGQAELLIVYAIINLDYAAGIVPDVRLKVEGIARELCDKQIVVVADLRSPYI